MDMKKLPVLAKVVIVINLVGAVLGIWEGFAIKNAVSVVLGVAGLIFLWGVYNFERWGLVGFSVLVGLNALAALVAGPLKMLPIPTSVVLFLYNAGVLFYFHSKRVKPLFQK